MQRFEKISDLEHARRCLDQEKTVKNLYQRHLDNPDDKGGVVEILPGGEIGDKIVDFN